MALEKFIRGKHDDAKHDGAYSNQKRLEAAQFEETLAEQLVVSMAVYRQREHLPAELVSYHTEILKTWGII